MSRKTIFALWGVLFVVCAAAAFLPQPQGLGRWAMLALALAFFLPPAVLLYRGESRDRRFIAWLSGLSLGLTLLLLVLNFLSALRSQLLGDVLYAVLSVVSTPMVCSGYWALSLFLWACLLMVSLRKGKMS